MGTNFYLVLRADLPTWVEPPRLHIGKSSVGWCFAMRVYPDDDGRPSNFAEWMTLLEHEVGSGRARIEDEYGSDHSFEEMRARITDRSFSRVAPRDPPAHYPTWADFHEQNHSEPGPNGLMRARIDGKHCIGHGPGTWDYIVGEFE